MKSTILRSATMLGLSLLMAATVRAQEEPKVKNNHHEWKYKSDDYKVKLQKDEDKFKSRDWKVKENSNERKVKGYVRPMRLTKTEKITIKTGEEQVSVSPHQPVPMTSEQQSTTKRSVTKKTTTRRYAARGNAQKRMAMRSTKSTHRYAMHRKSVKHYAAHMSRNTQKVATQEPVYLHDTVYVTRVDTVIKMQRMNTYSGYRIPRGDFKKVKLKRDRDGRVWMKRKE